MKTIFQFYYKLILLTVFFIVMNFFSIYAQKYDSTYYEKYLNRLCTTLSLSNRNYRIAITNNPYSPEKDTIDVIYKGNTPLTTGVTLDWDIFSLSFSFYGFSNNEDKKGSSEAFNVYFGWGNAKYIAETYYRYLKGFYDTRSNKYDSIPGNDDEYNQQPNLTQQILRGKFIYVFNSEKFAFKNGYTAIYHQKKTAGSFLLQGNVFYNKQDNNNSFVPAAYAQSYAYSYQVNYLSNLGFSLGGGYAGTLVMGKDYFINGTLFLMGEFQHNKLSKTSGDYKEYDNWNAGSESRLCLGHNGRVFYLSVALRAETSIYRLYDIGLRNSILFTDFNIGYRFKVKDPKFMSKVRQNFLYKVFD